MHKAPTFTSWEIGNSQFQFTDSVANNLFIIQTATLFRLRSHIQQIVKYVCFGFIGILKSVHIIL